MYETHSGLSEEQTICPKTGTPVQLIMEKEQNRTSESQSSSQSDFLGTLRAFLEQGLQVPMTMSGSQLDSIDYEYVTECARKDPLGTVEELLAFSQTSVFQALKKDRILGMSIEQDLLKNQTTRELFIAYQTRKATAEQGSLKSLVCSQQSLSRGNGKNNRPMTKRKRYLLCLAIGVASVLFILGVAYKYRNLLVRIIKLILNIS